jgi:drug/metabolite transporter (DMT)-like permease
MKWAWLSASRYAGQLLLLRLVGETVTPPQLFVVACLIGGVTGAAIVASYLIVVGTLPFPSWTALPIVATAEAAGWASFFALYAALRVAAVGPASVIQELGPVLATGAAWILFGERLSGWQMLGFSMAIVGAVLVQRGAVVGS